MKTIDYSYFIEKYIAGEMDQAEKTWFEKELEADKSLQNELLLRKKTDKILVRQDIISLRNKLASIEKSRMKEATLSTYTRAPRFRYAAVITGLILIGSILLIRNYKQSNEDIFNSFYETYQIQANSRSAEAVYQEAIDSYTKGDFSNALAGFRSYLQKNPGSVKFHFLSGTTNMELKNYPDAEISFIKVIDNKPNLYFEDANYYLALCYIIKGDIGAAKTQLGKIINTDSKYKKLAKSALRKL